MNAPHRSRTRATSLAAGLLVAALAATGWPTVAAAAPSAPAGAAVVAAPADLPTVDPGVLGPEAVDELTFDLGDEAFQPEGFPGKVELRGQVYAPQTIVGRAPVVLLMHGRHVTCGSTDADLDLAWPCPAGVPEIPSYRGYGDLGRNLASHGVVVVSVGANGVNAADGYLDDGGASARAQLVLEHLRRLQAWDASATGAPFGSRFVGHLDLTDVGLMGHSRGGEGVVAGAQLNQRIGSPFGIRAVLALAPVDFGRRLLGGVPLGVVLPYCDGDVSDLQGASYYDDARHASPGDPAAKMTALLYGANHNFFNTVWTTGPGSGDDADYFGTHGQVSAPKADPVDPCQAGGAGRLTAAQQVASGVALVGGFLRHHLLADEGLQRLVTGTAPFPASVGPARWTIAHHAPVRLDVESWATADTFRVNRLEQLAQVTGFSGGTACNPSRTGSDPEWMAPATGLTAVPCPGVDILQATNDTAVLDASWVRPGAYVRQVLAPAGRDVTAYDGVRFRVAVPVDDRNGARANQDLSVVLEDADGNRASVPVGPTTNGLGRMAAGQVQHAVLGGVRLPLTSFAGVDLTRVRAVELRFDRTPAGRLSVSDLAFTAEGTGSAVGPTDRGPVGPAATPACRRTAAERWACALVQAAWGRQPTTDERRFVAAGYGSAASRAGVANALVRNPEAGRHQARRLSQAFAQAPIDDAYLDAIVSDRGRAAWEVGIDEVISGTAFANPRVVAPLQVVVAAYQSLTGRSPDAAALAYWVPRTAGRTDMLVGSLRTSTAHRNRVVEERYLQVLGRAPDAGGRAYWVSRLGTRGADQTLTASLLGSESFRAGVTA